MKRNLTVNFIEKNCEICDKPFYVRKEGGKGRGRSTRGIRTRNSLTCSHNCSIKRKNSYYRIKNNL